MSSGAPEGRRAAFVLTGGGSLGAVQVGMMAALHERGIDPDVLVGTSVGAVNAAYLAGPGSTADRLSSLAALWSGIRRRDVFVLDPRRCLRATVGSAPSMFSGRPLRQLLERHLGYRAFEGARLQLAVAATDVVTGEGVLLDTGPVVDAVAASSAVPGLLPPVRRAGRALVDGAVGHAGALAYADARGVDDIYLIPAGYPCAGPRPTSALGVALTALNLMLHRQLVEEVQAHAGHARLHVVPPLCPLATSPADFTHSRALMVRAQSSTRDWLDQSSPSCTDAGPAGAGVLAFHGPHPARSALHQLPTTRPTAAPMIGRDA
jgi:NTE family protein